MNFVLVLLSFVFCGTVVARAKHNYAFTICMEDSDCAELRDAVCKDEICHCGNSSICVDLVNLVVTQIGEKCKYSKDCNIENSDCGPNKTCICEEGMVASSDLRKCLNVTEGLGDDCEDSVQCYAKISGSGCQKNKCVCQQHTHEYNGHCFRDVELGGKCESTGNCSHVASSRCEKGTCGCIYEFVASGSRCLPVGKGEHAPCEEDIQCTTSLGGASRCQDGFCTCKELYQIKQKTNKCVRDLVLNESCMKHSDCHGPIPGDSRLECVLGVCKCRYSFVEQDGFCTSSSSSSLRKVSSQVIAILNIILLYVLMK